MSPMSPRLAGRRLYIADLLRRLAALESGQTAMHAVTYRLLAKRLHSALAGEVPAALRQGFPELPASLQPLLREALETRHFVEFGCLQGSAADQARAAAQALALRLRGRR